MLLLLLGFWVPPVGIIDSFVLVAFGEMSTFTGALLGIDYRYRYDASKTLQEMRKGGVPASNSRLDAGTLIF